MKSASPAACQSLVLPLARGCAPAPRAPRPRSSVPAPASEPVPLCFAGGCCGLTRGPAAAGGRGDCSPSTAPRCILITGNICTVGKCIFGVQPTSSLNANYENSFSEALTPDLTWGEKKRKDYGLCIFFNM